MYLSGPLERESSERLTPVKPNETRSLLLSIILILYCLLNSVDTDPCNFSGFSFLKVPVTFIGIQFTVGDLSVLTLVISIGSRVMTP